MVSAPPLQEMGNQIDKVIPGLFVGGFGGADQKKKLKENNITHVLAIHDTAEPLHPEEFTYKCIKVSDTSSSNLSVYFKECLDFIHESRLKGGVVFVHCAAGISRSVTIVVMYIMTVSTLDFEEALTVVQLCREMANPNFGFRMQLKKYSETKLQEERERVRASYPETDKLNDEPELRIALKQAREKFGQRKEEDPFPYNPDAFTQKKSN